MTKFSTEKRNIAVAAFISLVFTMVLLMPLSVALASSFEIYANFPAYVMLVGSWLHPAVVSMVVWIYQKRTNREHNNASG